MIIIVTGTNTNVGKTIATAALAAHYHAGGTAVTIIKPAQTGTDSDINHIHHLTGIPGMELAHYPEPLAPNIAARRANMTQLDLQQTAEIIRSHDRANRIVLVEGAGGLLVRIADTWTIADLATQLDAPIIVVTSTSLGSLNSAELTIEAAHTRGLTVLGLIGGAVPRPPDLATTINLKELPAITNTPLLGWLPEGAGQLAPTEFQQVALQITLPRGGKLT